MGNRIQAGLAIWTGTGQKRVGYSPHCYQWKGEDALKVETTCDSRFHMTPNVSYRSVDETIISCSVTHGIIEIFFIG